MSEQTAHEGKWILGIDTCGPTGTVALGRLLAGGHAETVEQRELPGKSYAALLTPAIRELLASARASVGDLAALVAVHGPGSFTGVRVGLSTVKGLAEAAGTPVVAVSRLAALAHKAGVRCAALDAHRHEVFLRLEAGDAGPRELLAGPGELTLEAAPGEPVAVCDDAAADRLWEAWPEADLVHVAEPTAADALELAAPEIAAGRFADLVLLDGNYLRRSDAEIFGEAAGTVRGA